MRKENQGEEFVGLEDLEQLMNPDTNAENVVELEGGVFDADGVAQPEFMRQELAGEEAEETPEAVLKFGYGFNFKRRGIFEQVMGFNQFSNIEIDKRYDACLKLDYAVHDLKTQVINSFCPTQKFLKAYNYDTPQMVLDEEDMVELEKIYKISARLYKKIAVNSDMELRHVLLSLIDIVFAYVYDNKVNSGSVSPDSASMVVQLAPTLSCLVRYNTALEAFTTAMRRSLCYGLYRTTDFVKMCKDDTVEILVNNGVEGIIHILLILRNRFSLDQQYRYLLNDLFIDDYIRYLRDVLEPKDYQWLVEQVIGVVDKITPHDYGLNTEYFLDTVKYDPFSPPLTYNAIANITFKVHDYPQSKDMKSLLSLFVGNGVRTIVTTVHKFDCYITFVLEKNTPFARMCEIKKRIVTIACGHKVSEWYSHRLLNIIELEEEVFDADGVAQPEFMRQELAGEEAEETPEAVLKFGYGFNFKRHGVLGRFREELKELFDISYEIEESPIDERTELCLRLDIAAFDPQYFLAEYFVSPDMMAESLRFETPKMELDDDDIKELDKIRKKRVVVKGDMELRHVLLSLIDIVFAYVYDNKVNTGDSTCESAWTYTKLAPTFSCLARYETALEAYTTAMRRSLCYGVHRRFDFAKRCAVDTASIIQNDGIEGIIHILLKVKKSLASDVQYGYLLNDLFIDDYIRYLRDVLQPKDYHRWSRGIIYVVEKIDLKSMCLDLEELIAKGGLAVELGDVKEALDSDDDEEEVEQV